MVNRPLFSRCKIDEGLVIWFLFLDHLARKCIQQANIDNLTAIKSRRGLLIKNEETQKKLRQFFSPYQPFCRECQDCCYISLPFFHVDCFLFEIDPGSPLVAQPTAFMELLKRMLRLLTPNVIRDFIRFLVTRGEQEEKTLINPPEENDYAVCPFLTKTGCGLPYGRRPVM